ncbi:uncharacterized protein PFLUO_LOCUS5558 [Penicillium psychrofluorescens]|uniref:uncharacterized protein n=1 Tax=Penicillium psychrofluorescens TaxID=3158075 RepID=UPI003CCD39D5
MASTEHTSTTFTPERTFRSYDQSQGIAYSRLRPNYHPNLYKTIIDHHLFTGGELTTILDVGCGPGNAVRDLAPHFIHAIGLDPSEGMISTARSLGGVSSNGQAIRFEMSTAEDLGSQSVPPIPNSSVDLIVAATAAHWFDMPRFWRRAAEILKPGGTVALWAVRGGYPHPSMPNHAAIQASMLEIEDRYLKPYMDHGTLLAKGLYTDLGLPWSISEPVVGFERETFYRKDWNRDVPCTEGDEFFAGQSDPRYLSVVLRATEKMLGTRGTVIRWREAHPDLAGTESDVARIMCKEIERLLHEAGVEQGDEIVKMGVDGVLLMVKRDHE